MYNNPEKKEKECSKCHKRKLYSKFKRMDDGSGKVRSICKNCAIQAESDKLQMISWINKIEAIRGILQKTMVNVKFMEIGDSISYPY